MQTCKNVITNVVEFFCHFGCTDNDEDCEEREKSICYFPPERSISELNAKYKRIRIYDGSQNKNVNVIKKSMYRCSKSVKKKKSWCSSKEEDDKACGSDESDEIVNCDNSCEEDQGCISRSTQTDNKEKCSTESEMQCEENSNKKTCDEGVQNTDDDEIEEECEENDEETDNDVDEDDEDLKLCPKKRGKKRRANSSACKRVRKKRLMTKSCPCDRLDKQLLQAVMAVRKKTLKKQLKSIEQRARKLWQCYSTKMPLCKCCNFKNTKWCKLLSHQKFPFFWAILVGDFLCPTPYENFVRFYLEENNLELYVMDDCDFAKSIKEIWNGLRKSAKMPFITEAFLHIMSQGKVNLSNDCDIRNEFNRLYKDSC